MNFEMIVAANARLSGKKGYPTLKFTIIDEIVGGQPI